MLSSLLRKDKDKDKDKDKEKEKEKDKDAGRSSPAKDKKEKEREKAAAKERDKAAKQKAKDRDSKPTVAVVPPAPPSSPGLPKSTSLSSLSLSASSNRSSTANSSANVSRYSKELDPNRSGSPLRSAPTGVPVTGSATLSTGGSTGTSPTASSQHVAHPHPHHHSLPPHQSSSSLSSSSSSHHIASNNAGAGGGAGGAGGAGTGGTAAHSASSPGGAAAAAAVVGVIASTPDVAQAAGVQPLALPRSPSDDSSISKRRVNPGDARKRSGSEAGRGRMSPKSRNYMVKDLIGAIASKVTGSGTPSDLDTPKSPLSPDSSSARSQSRSNSRSGSRRSSVGAADNADSLAEIQRERERERDRSSTPDDASEVDDISTLSSGTDWSSRQSYRFRSHDDSVLSSLSAAASTSASASASASARLRNVILRPGMPAYGHAGAPPGDRRSMVAAAGSSIGSGSSIGNSSIGGYSSIGNTSSIGSYSSIGNNSSIGGGGGGAQRWAAVRRDVSADPLDEVIELDLSSYDLTPPDKPLPAVPLATFAADLSPLPGDHYDKPLPPLPPGAAGVSVPAAAASSSSFSQSPPKPLPPLPNLGATNVTSSKDNGDNNNNKKKQSVSQLPLHSLSSAPQQPLREGLFQLRALRFGSNNNNNNNNASSSNKGNVNNNENNRDNNRKEPARPTSRKNFLALNTSGATATSSPSAAAVSSLSPSSSAFTSAFSLRRTASADDLLLLSRFTSLTLLSPPPAFLSLVVQHFSHAESASVYFIEPLLSLSDAQRAEREHMAAMRASDEDVYYETHFVGKDHYNYLGFNQYLGFVAISLRKESGGMYRSLLRTKEADQRFHFSLKQKFRKPSDRKIFEVMNPFLTPDKLVKVTSSGEPDLVKSLLDFEQLKVSKLKKTKVFKVGVLLVRDGQRTENDFYNNIVGSRDYDEFLQFLGQRVALAGWPHFAGGLDISPNAHGTYSVYTRWRENEVMFHVSTLLPLSSNPQQIDRKRHIGNDMVVVVFVDAESLLFDPTVISSHYNHVFIVVAVDRKQTGRTRYRVSVVQKEGVPFFFPRLSVPAVYEKNDIFRAFLLDKCINGELASLNAAGFRSRLLSTRQKVLQVLCEQYYAVPGDANIPSAPTTPKSPHRP